MDKKLSVIIPVRNDKRVCRAIESVRNNELTEIIVVDGASTDDTKDALETMRSKINTLISEPDEGFYDAVNKGIKLSSGQWIFVLAADDVLLIDPLDIINKYESENAELLCGSVIEHIGKGQYRINISNPDLEQMKKECTLRHPATFFRRSVYTKYGFYDINYKCAGDREFFLRLITKGAKIKIIEDLVVLFEFGGMSSKEPIKFFWKEDIPIAKQYSCGLFLAYGILLKRIILLFGHTVKDFFRLSHQLKVYTAKEMIHIIEKNHCSDKVYEYFKDMDE